MRKYVPRTKACKRVEGCRRGTRASWSEKSDSAM